MNFFKPAETTITISKRSWKEQFSLFETYNYLDFKGQDTQYSTHALHTYVAAMVPQLAEILVNTFVPKAEKVLDPFCGGGAVLVESVRNGIKASGSDINPLAILISKVKSTYLDRKTLEHACNYVHSISSRELNGSYTFPSNYNVEYWFYPKTIVELSSIIRIIQKCEIEVKFDTNVIDALKVIFSATVRDVMLTYRNEVRLRHLEPDDLTKFRPNAFNSFASRCRIAIDRIPMLPKNSRVQVLAAQVQNLPYPDKTFHTIICSPPYGDEKNGVSYMQFSKFMLYWLGFSRESVALARKKTLGYSLNDFSLPSPTLQKAFSTIMKIDNSNNGINFYRDYYLGLQQMIRVTRENIIIVIGNRILKQTVIENGKITAELMLNLGWKLHQRFERTLPSKRLPKLRREENHGFGGAINKEDILIFKQN